MSVEGSLVRPESATGLCEKEQGTGEYTGFEMESIPEWSLNVETYELLQEGQCTYNAEEQSLVWPPMLLICSFADLPDKDLDDDVKWLRNMLTTEGVQANDVAETKHVCCEGNTTFHLFVLPPSGTSFEAAKIIDSMRGLDFCVFYPSLKDMIDIKNGRVPEFSRRLVEGLKYHGRPSQAWINLAVDLVRDDGICVGRGVCQKYEATDFVNEEPLGEIHVGVRVLEVLDDLLPSHWKGSLRRWRSTHVLYNGVSLFECLRQSMQDESEDWFCKDGSDSAGIAQAQGVLRDQCISSVFPSISISKDLNEFNHLSATYAMTCRNAIDDIEKSTFKSDSEGPSLHDGKSFATNLDFDESLRKDEIKKIAKDASLKRKWMKHLGTIHSSHLARDVVKRLTVLRKLTTPAKSGTLISSMIKQAEDMEIGLLNSIGERIKWENKRKTAMVGFDKEMESLILRRRREQQKELLQELANMNAKHYSAVDGLVLGKFKFLNNIGKTVKETENVQQWVAHHTAKATDEEKKKWEEEAAKARMEEQKKWEEEAAKTRMEEQKKWEEEAAKARMEEQKKWEEEAAKARMEEQKKWEEQAAKARMEEQKKWEEEAAKARIDEQKKWEEQAAKARMEEQKKWEEQAAEACMYEQKMWEEQLEMARMKELKSWEKEVEQAKQLAKSRTEQKKCQVESAKVMIELAVAKQELADAKQELVDQEEAMPKCIICFEDLEGTMAKCGQKRSRIDVAQRKRACFTPCMHSSMCLECAVAAWEKFKRCPVCSIPCSSKPQTIFM